MARFSVDGGRRLQRSLERWLRLDLKIPVISQMVDGHPNIKARKSQ